MNKDIFKIILIFLIFSGAFLRLYGLGDQSLWIDESYSVTAAIGMMEHLVPAMPSGELYTSSILNTSSIALSMTLFGINEFAARLPSVLFGVLTIIITYFFSKKLFGKEVAVITSFLITFSIVEIAWSRQARMYQQLQFFYILSLFIFYKYANTREIKLGLLTILSIVCAILTHPLGLSLLLIIPAYLALINIKYIRLNFKKEFFKKRVFGIIFLVFSSIALSEFFFNAVTHVLTVQTNYSENYLWYLKTFFPIIFYLSIAGIIIGFREKWKETLLPFLAIIIPFYFIFFHEKLLGYRYLFLSFPFIFLFFSRTVKYISEIISGLITKNFNKILRISIILILLAVISLGSSLNFIPKNEYYLEPMAPQPKFDSVYYYLLDNIEEGDVLIVSYPEIALWYNLTPNYWLAFAISGFSSSNWMNENKTHYKRTMTPVIRDLEELENIYKNNERGWIVLDSLSGSRIPPEYWKFIKNNTKWFSEPSRPGIAGAINLYGWDKTPDKQLRVLK